MENIRNYEGYYDPTAGKAIRSIEKKRKRVENKDKHLYYQIGESKQFKAINNTSRVTLTE